jgi:outer membrane protein, heavy metal efflux system
VKNTGLLIAAIAVMTMLDLRSTRAEGPAVARGPCAPPITRENLVSCALAVSLPSLMERQEARAVQGRFTAASPILPSNPVVSLTGSRRLASGTGLAGYNWSASLSQELELAGQRGARRRTVSAERQAQSQVMIGTDREVAFRAWSAFFELLAAQEGVALARRLEDLSRRVLAATRAAADKGLIAAVDADVADAALLRIAQLRIAAERDAQSANAALASLLGLDRGGPLAVQGTLEPLQLDVPEPALTGDTSIEHRPEVQALEASRRSLAARADYYRKARWPSPTLSVFTQNDETNHMVLGLGLAMPIVLPHPIGRTYAGEIDESLALSDKLAAQAAEARRAARVELALASETHRASRQAAELYTEARVRGAEKSLQSIATEIEAGRLAAREALIAQQTLMDLLRASVEARLALCLSSVELAKAAGIPLERGGVR